MRLPLFLVVLAFLAGPSLAQVLPLPHAHAHNDYEHERPLFDALDQGFCSVEADIHLVDGALLVAHDRKDVQAGRTIQALYLDPLRKRTEEYGGLVYPGVKQFQLLVDLKSGGEETYAALRKVLQDYHAMLTCFREGKAEPGAVTIVLTGNSPNATVAAEKVRWVGVDGRVPDIGPDLDAGLMPLVSDHWMRHFTWRGEGDMPAEEREKLERIVQGAHARGARLRFWATPESKALWKELLAAGVDYINTDQLRVFRRFSLSEGEATGRKR